MNFESCSQTAPHLRSCKSGLFGRRIFGFLLARTKSATTISLAAAQLDVDRNFVATRYAIGRWEVDGLYRDYKREVALANELEDQESRDFIIIAAVFNFQSAMHHLVFREHRSSLRDFESFVHDVIVRLEAERLRAAPEEPPAHYKSWADYYNALEEKVLWDLELAKGPRPPPPPPYIPSPPGVTPPPPPLRRNT